MFFGNITETSQIWSPDCVYFSSYSLECVSHFMLSHFDDFIRFENLWKVKIWLSQEWKELSKSNKKHFSLFHKCSLADIQNKPVKM